MTDVRHEKHLADQGTARIEQVALADFLVRGELDRHLRRMRARYRVRRDAMIEALAAELPEATVRGIAAGLHVTVELPTTDDEAAIRREASRRRVELGIMGDHRTRAGRYEPTHLLGYPQLPESAIRAGVHELAEAVRAARAAA